MSLDALFEPFAIKSLTLKNRFVLAAMSRYRSKGGAPNAELAAYHRRRAEGGVALSITGATGVDRPAANNHPHLANINEDTFSAWRRVVDEVHGAGGAIALQAWHAGALFNVDPNWTPAPIESPSGLVARGEKKGVAMTEEDVADAIRSFGRAARLGAHCGFDAIEIHGAHGFLIDEFFWADTNLRTDRWGGPTIAERARFAAAVIRETRAAVGPDTPILIRLSQWKEQDYTARIAETPEQMRQWLEPLAEAGADVFDCSQRRFWEPEFPGSDLNFAGWAKKLTAKPTITVGSIGLSTDVMSSFHGEEAKPASLGDLERRFARGDFDLVAIGRPLLADPQWIAKIRDGRFDELKSFRREDAESAY